MIRDGLIQQHPQEADAVRYIYGQYLAGASLLTIAENMTRQGVRYHQRTAEWNKNMVKRILENARWQTEVTPDLFENLVEQIMVASAGEVKFRLLNGLELTERLV